MKVAVSHHSLIQVTYLACAKKPDGSWGMTVDYHILNQAVTHCKASNTLSLSSIRDILHLQPYVMI